MNILRDYEIEALRSFMRTNLFKGSKCGNYPQYTAGDNTTFTPVGCGVVAINSTGGIGGGTPTVYYAIGDNIIFPDNPKEGDILILNSTGDNTSGTEVSAVYDGTVWTSLNPAPVDFDFPSNTELITVSRDITDADRGKLLRITGNNVVLTMPNSLVFSEYDRMWIGFGNVIDAGYTTEYGRAITYPLAEKSEIGTNDSRGQIITFICIPDTGAGHSVIVEIATTDGNKVDPSDGLLKSSIRYLMDNIGVAANTIYTADDILAGDRVVSGNAAASLTFDALGGFTINAFGDAVAGATTGVNIQGSSTASQGIFIGGTSTADRGAYISGQSTDFYGTDISGGSTNSIPLAIHADIGTASGNNNPCIDIRGHNQNIGNTEPAVKIYGVNDELTAPDIFLQAGGSGIIQIGGLRIAGGAPITSSDAGVAGQIAFDSNYIYYCFATNTWKRVAISTW